MGQITIRVRDELMVALKAKAGRRGLNGAVVALLEGWVEGTGAATASPSNERIHPTPRMHANKPEMPKIAGMVRASELGAARPVEAESKPEPMFCVHCGEPGRLVKGYGQAQVLCWTCKPEAR